MAPVHIGHPEAIGIGDIAKPDFGDALEVAPDELPGGHLPALAHPEELVARLEAYRVEAGLR